MTAQKTASWAWPLGIMAALGTTMAVNIAILILAIRTSPDLIEDQPYERGLVYQAKLDDFSRFIAFGWNVSFDVSSADLAQGRTLHLRLTSKEGLPIQGARVLLTAIRPSDAAFDQHLELLEGSIPGVYSSLLRGPRGLWIMRLLIRKGGMQAQVDRKEIL